MGKLYCVCASEPELVSSSCLLLLYINQLDGGGGNNNEDRAASCELIESLPALSSA